ncbi:hypothetical protein MGYG_08188 [Nannizzia gypsea CBS 118893]|uniref:Uncharacterized protein n=1 Tax=Arthroderma gypseum (strain ATCC MYA-4604 / CBS 118893) TaxID=535722 RepID=E4V5A0_ARTGP|nr:hypothetical protein MGYG_08188 [Nannizzia gypsea CBS 118893]EFR05174.1 hypothetical protein MGYG_08188 [Nannizzia gypsea CBS 118893]
MATDSYLDGKVRTLLTRSLVLKCLTKGTSGRKREKRFLRRNLRVATRQPSVQSINQYIRHLVDRRELSFARYHSLQPNTNGQDPLPSIKYIFGQYHNHPNKNLQMASTMTQSPHSSLPHTMHPFSSTGASSTSSSSKQLSVSTLSLDIQRAMQSSSSQPKYISAGNNDFEHPPPPPPSPVGFPSASTSWR